LDAWLISSARLDWCRTNGTTCLVIELLDYLHGLLDSLLGNLGIGNGLLVLGLVCVADLGGLGLLCIDNCDVTRKG